MSKIDPTAEIRQSVLSNKVTVYGNVQSVKSQVMGEAVIGEDSRIERSILEGGNYINRRDMFSHVQMGKYSYTGYNNILRHIRIGRFCSLAWNISIGGGNHGIITGSTYPAYRWSEPPPPHAQLRNKRLPLLRTRLEMTFGLLRG